MAMKEPQEGPASEPEQGDDENQEETLGRGARTRAKVSVERLPRHSL